MKLRKLNNGYYSLYDSDGDIVASNNPDTPCSKRLSKQNCDNIFGGVNVEKLAEEIVTSHPDFKTEGFSDYQNGKLNGIIEGFNKSMELNKDKLFTVEDMVGYFDWHKKQGYVSHEPYDIHEYIQSLQQTEWDVEIETIQYGLGNDEDGRPVFETRNLLDENGCLILKRI